MLLHQWLLEREGEGGREERGGEGKRRREGERSTFESPPY